MECILTNHDSLGVPENEIEPFWIVRYISIFMVMIFHGDDMFTILVKYFDGDGV